MRILIGQFFQETNSFCPHIIPFEEWMSLGFHQGNEIRDLYKEQPHAIGGMIRALEEIMPSIEIIYGTDFRCHCNSGGMVDHHVMEVFLEKMLGSIDQELDIDGILLSFHGAMQTTESDDPEGEVVRILREKVGEKAVIAVSTDLHAYISDTLVNEADIICGYHTYPHTDYFETGYRAATLMLKKIQGHQLTSVKIGIPMIVPPSTYSTIEGPFKEVMDIGLNMMKSNLIEDFSIYQMQPWLDIYPGGSSIITIGKGDEQQLKCAKELAETLFKMRYKFQPKQLSIDTVIDKAIENNGVEPIILVDSSDSPNAGAAGDSMAVAKRIIEREVDIRSAIVVNDSRAVKIAFKIGVGNKASFHLGGDVDTKSVSIDAVGYVCSLHDGNFLAEGPAGRGMEIKIGKTAVIRFGKMDVVVCERIASPGEPQLYRAFGIEPTLYNLVVVKACTSFRAAYQLFTSKIYETDTPGSASANLQRLKFKKIPKSFWPWNELTDYEINEITWGR